MRLLFFLSLFVLLLGCAQQEAAPPAQSPAGQQQPVPSAPAEQPVPQEESVSEPQQPSAEPSSAPAATTSLKSEEVSYNSHGWTIHGTIYPNDDPTKAIILVPMLGHTRESYPMSFIERLHNEIPGSIILVIDPRGHGESTNLGTSEDFAMEDFRDMGVDVANARPFFDNNYPTVKQHYVVGASIGSTAAILATRQNNQIDKVAMLSPGMEYQDVSIERAVEDYLQPLFLAASSGDSYSVSSISEIESLSSSHVTKKIYDGSSHGTDMFEDTTVQSDLMEFLK